MRKRISFLSILALSGSLCVHALATEVNLETAPRTSLHIAATGDTVCIYAVPEELWSVQGHISESISPVKVGFLKIQSVAHDMIIEGQSNALNAISPVYELDAFQKVTYKQLNSSIDEVLATHNIREDQDVHDIKMMIMWQLSLKIQNYLPYLNQYEKIGHIESLFQDTVRVCNKKLRKVPKTQRVYTGQYSYELRYAKGKHQNFDRLKSFALGVLNELDQGYDKFRFQMQATKALIAQHKVDKAQEGLKRLLGREFDGLEAALFARGQIIAHETSYLPLPILNELVVSPSTGRVRHPALDVYNMSVVAKYWHEHNRWKTWM